MFAPKFPRNKRGWIEFPPDAALRRQLFPEDAMKHPAKANLFMLQAIIEYLYEPGETILDPMAGTGSLMIAALTGHRVICIDTSPVYGELLPRSRESILAIKPDAEIIVLAGDCNDYMPLPVDHICFSPPYSNIMLKKRITEKDDTLYFIGTDEEYMVKYSEGKGNVGRLPDFFHFQAMEKVFKGCYLSLPTGGTMTLITKDRIVNNRRQRQTRRYIKAAERVGFKLVEAFKWHAGGTGFVSYYKSLGREVVEDEDIVILRRE